MQGLTKITSVRSAAHPQWSPDGSTIAFDTPDSIYTTRADGTEQKLLFAGKRGNGPGVPSWSPDGTRLAFFNTPRQGRRFTAEVWTMNADGSDKRRLYHSACCVGIWAARSGHPTAARSHSPPTQELAPTSSTPTERHSTA